MSGLVRTNAKNVYLSNNWLMDAQHGWIKGWSAASKYGANPSVSTSFEDIWYAGGVLTWLTAAATIEAISDSANDAAAGTGARTIKIEGLDANWDEITETITMNGTSATTATSASFIRVNKAYVVTTGTYGGSNVGNITVRVSSAGSTQAYISATEGGSHKIHLSVPRLKIVNIHELHLMSDSSKETDFRVQVRENGDDVSSPYSPWITKSYYARQTGIVDISYLVPLQLPAKSDFRVQGIVQSTATYCGSEIKYSIHNEVLD